ncbi:MAG: DoxX family protein [Candidatus Micrarchaeota archaeon]|nr:DoxX family protein [Candidatus Micrarchaeota archaeon]MDE1847615.1 DoxX family protein [Candidatus Micrarchaeota archaeon]MDE1863818.1 DoxX family protein [Candidatus Micrarchaeota archaeon]
MGLNRKMLAADNWFSSNAFALSRVMEILFGLVWAIDASFKFQYSFVAQFSNLISSAAAGQPGWLAGWFGMWVAITSAHPALFAYMITMLETLLAISLLFGIARKIGYGGGFILSLLIWAVPEGFGGPYGPSSTDIGTGVVYAFGFVFLAIISSLYGPNKYTLDYFLEKRIPGWKSVAEIRQSPWFDCMICGLHYSSRALSEKCYKWCSTHNSCNLKIATQSLEAKGEKSNR